MQPSTMLDHGAKKSIRQRPRDVEVEHTLLCKTWDLSTTSSAT